MNNEKDFQNSMRAVMEGSEGVTGPRATGAGCYPSKFGIAKWSTCYSEEVFVLSPVGESGLLQNQK